MTETQWLAAIDPKKMRDFLLGDGVWVGEEDPDDSDEPPGHWVYPQCRVSDRKLRLFACACARRLWDLLVDERSRRAIEVAELCADGLASAEECQAASDAADAVGGFGLKNSACSAAASTAFGSGPSAAILTLDNCATANFDYSFRFWTYPKRYKESRQAHVQLLRDIFGNPFRPVTFDPEWLTSTVTALARQMYESHDFGAMPILADALQDAGCDNADILDHCRGPGPHVRGCWVVDLVLGKS